MAFLKPGENISMPLRKYVDKERAGLDSHERHFSVQPITSQMSGVTCGIGLPSQKKMFGGCDPVVVAKVEDPLLHDEVFHGFLPSMSMMACLTAFAILLMRSIFLDIYSSTVERGFTVDDPDEAVEGVRNLEAENPVGYLLT